MAKVGINGMKLYGYHGFFDEESIIGGWFVYDVDISYQLLKDNLNDELTKVIDYGTIAELIIKVNNERQKLIESLAFKLKDEIRIKFPFTDKITVRVSKLSPPLGKDIGLSYFEC